MVAKNSGFRSVRAVKLVFESGNMYEVYFPRRMTADDCVLKGMPVEMLQEMKKLITARIKEQKEDGRGKKPKDN